MNRFTAVNCTLLKTRVLYRLYSHVQNKAQILFVLTSAFFTGCANHLFYHPTREIYLTPERNGYTYEEITFLSADGTSLYGWYVPSQPEKPAPPKGIVIHFHGNSQNMSACYAYVAWLPWAGYDLFVFDYRGYGKSLGEPSRQGIYEDSLAALNYVIKRNIEHYPIFIIGQSLGGANAVTVVGCSQFEEIAGMLIDSTFYSYQSAARSSLSGNLLGRTLSIATPLLISNGLDPADWVCNISPIPIVFVHGTHDQTVPLSHTEALFEKAKSPKSLWIIEGGQHTDMLSQHRKEYIPKILQFFEDCAMGW